MFRYDNEQYPLMRLLLILSNKKMLKRQFIEVYLCNFTVHRRAIAGFYFPKTFEHLVISQFLYVGRDLKFCNEISMANIFFASETRNIDLLESYLNSTKCDD